MSTKTTHDVAVTRIFAAPVEQVWNAWSDSDVVMQWWGPTGFTSPMAEMNFQVGGASLVCMRAPAEYGGEDLYNTWRYTSIQPYDRIEFVLNFTDDDGTKLATTPPGVPSDVPHAVTFNSLGSSNTEMTVMEFGYTTAEARDMSQMGLEQCLDKMALLFQH